MHKVHVKVSKRIKLLYLQKKQLFRYIIPAGTGSCQLVSG